MHACTYYLSCPLTLSCSYALARKTRPRLFDSEGRFIRPPDFRHELPDGYRPKDYDPSKYRPATGVREKPIEEDTAKAEARRAQGDEGKDSTDAAAPGRDKDDTKDDGGGGSDGDDAAAKSRQEALDLLRKKREKHLKALEETIRQTKEEVQQAADPDSVKHAKHFLATLERAHEQMLQLNQLNVNTRRNLAAVGGGRAHDTGSALMEEALEAKVARILSDAAAAGVDAGFVPRHEDPATAEQHIGDAGGAGGEQRRKLLHYYGDSTSTVEVHTGSVFSWLKTWANVDWTMKRCATNLELFEERLNRFGYSLKNLSHYKAPEAFQSHLLLPY